MTNGTTHAESPNGTFRRLIRIVPLYRVSPPPQLRSVKILTLTSSVDRQFGAATRRFLPQRRVLEFDKMKEEDVEIAIKVSRVYF